MQNKQINKKEIINHMLQITYYLHMTINLKTCAKDFPLKTDTNYNIRVHGRKSFQYLLLDV